MSALRASVLHIRTELLAPAEDIALTLNPGIPGGPGGPGGHRAGHCTKQKFLVYSIHQMGVCSEVGSLLLRGKGVTCP